MTERRSRREVAATLERLRREISGEPADGAAKESTDGTTDGRGRAVREKAPASAVKDLRAPATPSRAEPRRRDGVGRGTLSSRAFEVSDAADTRDAIETLLRHRRRRLGRVVGIAGLPRHGKTTLADRLRERAAERPGADLRYNKTERGDVNVYYIPGRRTHPALVDMAGEDYRRLGDYDQDLPELMEKFLWPVLQRIDGLVLLLALPIVWAGWNDDRRAERQTPSAAERAEMDAAVRRMLNAHRMLLKYAVVARELRRGKRRMRRLGLSRAAAPSRDRVDDAFKRSRKFDRPVSLALSKADLYVGSRRPCLHSPNLPRMAHLEPKGVRPEASDPLLVAAAHFPEFQEFLERHVRHFKWSFCQALRDRSPYPDPLEARDRGGEVSSLIGGEGVLDFVTRHPWRVPGPSTAFAVRLDRRLRPDAWNEAHRAARARRTPGREP